MNLVPERICELTFKHFRGLPNNAYRLSGKNLVILGGNGRGKSAIVDGVEFLFSGRVSRFHGQGTGYVDPTEAIRHIRKKGIPIVEMRFTPTNATVRRQLGAAAAEVPATPSIQAYMRSHPRVEAFVLRRAQILDFVHARDADRYQRFVQLLGLADIDGAQRAFVEAAQRAESQLEIAKRNLERELASFRDPSTGLFLGSTAAVVARCADVARPLGVEGLTDWADLDRAIEQLEGRRWEGATGQIDALSTAVASLQRLLSSDLSGLVDRANTLHSALNTLMAASAEAQAGDVIREGLEFFQGHEHIETCPLCEQILQDGYAATFARLRERNASLTELHRAELERSESLRELAADAKRSADQLKDDLRHSALLGSEGVQDLRGARASLLRWWRLIRRVDREGSLEPLRVPNRADAVPTLRSKLTQDLLARRAALVPSETAHLENSIALLKNAKASSGALQGAEGRVQRSKALVLAATKARDAFTAAREAAIQGVFEHIAQKVLQYYRALHDYGDGAEQSECTALLLTSSSRAATGGLRLAIQFLGLADSCDPRAFLSEGHLDSLGLCLYLATVRLFNPVGTMLVLDDVLTSIDMEHRHRVGELLFSEFSDYQILITTHDEHWFSTLQSSARARGKQSEWVFNRIANWTLDGGPESAAFEGTWEFVEAHLNEDSFRELGGPLRLVLEDFLKRTAEVLKVRVEFRFDGKYVSGAFVNAGIQDAIRKALVEKSQGEENDITQDVARVFGAGDLINFLSHDNPGRLQVTLGQTKDFVGGLESLTARCKAHHLMKGVGG